MKKLLVFGLVVAALGGLYWFLGGLDASSPTPPDLDPGETRVADGENWYLALTSATNLVALEEHEVFFIQRAAGGGANWWRTDVPPCADEAAGWDRVDAILARHEGLFAHFAAHAHCTGWRRGTEEEGALPAGAAFPLEGRLLNDPPARLFDLKIARALARGDYDAALRDLAVFESLCTAARNGVGTCLDWRLVTAAWSRTCRRVLAVAAELDASRLENLQEIVDSAARDLEVSCARAYAREVQGTEARWNGLFRRDGAAFLLQQMTTAGQLLAKAVQEVAERNRVMLHPELARRVAPKAENAEKAEDESAPAASAELDVPEPSRPLVSRFSFHFNRTLAQVYDEACETHAALLRGRYDLPLRALQEACDEPPGWTRYVRPLLPNAMGAHVVRLAVGERVLVNRWLADVLFDAESARLVVAANRYRLKNGSYPLALEELVPAYLEAVPRDPFGEGLIGFNVAQRTVHSVGETGGFDGVIPSTGAKGLSYVDKHGTRQWHTTIRRLDGQPL